MRNNITAVSVTLLALALALLLAALAGGATSARIADRRDSAQKDAIDLAFNGNDGYTEVTEDCAVSGVTAVYLVKSGTGGEDGICVFSTASSRGCTVRLLTAFSHDGIISSVHLLDAEGTPSGAGQLIAESGILAAFGGVSYDTQSVAIKGIDGADGCSGAVVRGVNYACAAVSKLLYTEESSEEVSQ